MNDETENTPSTPDPSRFVLDDGSGAFWLELVIRNQDGTYETSIGQLRGALVDGETPTEVEFDQTLASALRQFAQVIRSGRERD